MDMERPARSAIEVEMSRALGLAAAYDPRWSPVKAALAGEAPRDEQLAIARMYPMAARRLPMARLRSLAGLAASAWAMLAERREGRLDFHNPSPLLDEYLEGNTLPVVPLRPERWPVRNAPLPRHMKDFVTSIAEAVERCLNRAGCCAELSRRSARITNIHANEHLTQAYSRIESLRSSFLGRHVGSTLVGGTPKDVGRALNWHYARAGRNIWRFSHGGDRAFFSDPVWPMTELPWVTRYYVHGKSEASNLRGRFSDHEVARGVEFVSLGSRRHQKWWREGEARRKAHAKSAAGKTRKIILFSGAFLGESLMGPLDFRQPDPLALDAQFHAARILLKQGFELHVKPHPDGLKLARSLYAPLGVPIIEGRFDARAMDADCYVFEFAGSAFFDALACERGIVLLDTGARRWDPAGKKDLALRCEIVTAKLDERNRTRADEAELLEAVNRACDSRGCPEEFAQGYFFG
ncbi:MAG: hypothetical protein AB7G34_14910 [Hyphomicrobiales bacterium]